MKSLVQQDPLIMELDQQIATELNAIVADEFDDHVGEMRSKVAVLAGLNTTQELRHAITKYQKAIIEYVKLCHQHWREMTPRTDTVFQPGLCIFHLGMMIISLKGEGVVEETLRDLGFGVGADVLAYIPRQVEIARQVMRNYDQDPHQK